MLIYTEQISNRLVYTLDFVFKDHELHYRLTNDWNEFTEYTGEKLAYTAQSVVQYPHLFPSKFLFEESYRTNIQVAKMEWNGVECLQVECVVDPLAAIFYVLSRYEEYAPKFPDKHGRFTAKESIQSKYGWLQKQIVERWIEAFFTTFFPSALERLRNKESVCIPSFDIDNTFAHQWKEGWRSWLSNTKDFLLWNKARRIERKMVQSGQLKDPFDSFDEIREIVRTFPQTRVFWHLGDYKKYDTNIFWKDERHMALIRRMMEDIHVGLHPSYASNNDDRILSEEKLRIETIGGKEVVESRQHFLKLQLPTTYLRLIQLGFKKDFSMGFADVVGFRSGTAFEHAFFDLKRNTYHSNYRIVPFCYMDGTLHEYMHLTIEQSKQQIDELICEVKRYGGNFCFIWHNETLAEAGKWKGWKEVFDYTLARWNELK